MHFRSLRELDDSEGNVRLHDGKDTAIILYPAPSPIDPNDPLRWPLWRKHVAFGSVCAFAFLSNYAIGGLAPAFYILSMQFGKSQHQTSELLLWPVLVFGLFVRLALTCIICARTHIHTELSLGTSGESLRQTTHFCFLYASAVYLLHMGCYSAEL